MRRLVDAVRWLPWALAAVLAVLFVVSVTSGRTVPAVVEALLCAYWVWQARRAARPRPPAPAHTDEEWARGVLRAAGEPRGVPAVKALRDAEPALSLLDAKELADRVRA